MKLNSLDELECFLPEEEREYKKMLSQWPSHLRTGKRILPRLPRWMRNKVTEAKELYDHQTACSSYDNLLNHTITLPLDKRHDITFSIDDSEREGQLDKTIATVVEVYKDLQVIYRKYKYPLTIVSMWTDDFGMYLPSSFYYGETGIFTKRTVFWPDYLQNLVEKAKETAENLSEEERTMFNTSFENKYKQLMDYYTKMRSVTGRLKHPYYCEPMWESVDLYMDEGRQLDREFCVKWPINESLGHLRFLDDLRPLIDAIIEKTNNEFFAFGVKPRGTTVLFCNE